MRVVSILICTALMHSCISSRALAADDSARGGKSQSSASGSYKAPYPSSEPEVASPYSSAQSPAQVGSEPKPDTVQFAQKQIKNKDYKGALRTYKIIFLARPYDADVLLGMAYCSDQLGDVDQAIQYAKQATDAAPTSSETHIARGHYLEKNREYNAAYLQYSRALDLKPAAELLPQIYVPTLRILLATNKYDVAERLARKWAREHSKDAACQYNLGLVLSQSEDEKTLPDAVAAYETALKLDPSLVATHYNLALLYYKMGDRSHCKEALQQFMTLAPKDPDIAQAKVLLSKLK